MIAALRRTYTDSPRFHGWSSKAFAISFPGRFFVRLTRIINSFYDLESSQPLFTRYQRFPSMADRVGEIQKLPLERNNRHRHRVRCPGSAFRAQRCGITAVLLHIPRDQFAAGNNGAPMGAMNFNTLCVARPKRCGGLNDPCCPGLKTQDGIDDIFRLDTMNCAQLPVRTYLLHRAGKPADQVNLVNGLIDERAAPFAGPRAFAGAGIVLRGTVPLDVAVAFEECRGARR